jgi:uncharacterized protein (DUF1501 family)
VPLRAVALGELSQSLRGNVSVSTISSLAQSGLGELGRRESETVKQFLNHDLTHYMGESYALNHADNVSRNLLHQHGHQLLSDLEVLASIDPTLYQVENGALYSDSKLATDLKNAAQLIKSNWGVEVISISNGGWDTHTNQGGQQGIKLKNLQIFQIVLVHFIKIWGIK